MTNYDFDNVLKKYNNDPREVLARYSYESGKYIFDRINDSNCDSSELSDIVNSIVLWKINRSVNLSEKLLLELKSIQNINSPLIALNEKRNDIRNLIIQLVKSKGVRLAMASTFLHFFNPNVFPIIDQRAYRVVFKEDYKASTVASVNADVYLSYLEKCVEYYNEKLKGIISFSDIDKFLYQLDILAKNRIRNYG